MTKGQRAIAVAKDYPEPEKPKRSGNSKIEHLPVHRGTLSQARAVLRALPTVADAVLAGELSLTDAFERAQQHQTRQ